MDDPVLARMTEVVRILTAMSHGEGLIGVDHAFVRSIFMEDGGLATSGVGEASGPNRGNVAAERALVDAVRGFDSEPKTES